LKADLADLYDAAMDAGTPAGSMDKLIARLEALFRSYAGGLDGAQLPTLDEIIRHFRDEIRTLVDEFGASAVDEAFEAIPRDGWPSNALH
jgi:hypothetical protein